MRSSNRPTRVALEAKDVASVAGKIGQAVQLRTESVLAYPTAVIYDPHRGTVDLWVRPNWGQLAE